MGRNAEDILQDYGKEGERLIPPSHPLLQYEGRIDFSKAGGPLWTYPATSVRLRFRGKRLCAVLNNYHLYWDNSLGCLLDGREYCLKLQEQGISFLTLYEGEGDEVHELLLFKRQDSCHMIQLHGFIGSGDLELLPCEPMPERRIEVYGDSVSAGEVSEAIAYCGEPDPEHSGQFSNSYHSYAWITARKLHARLHDIAQGGIALMDGIGYYNEPFQEGMESVFDKIQYQTQILKSEKYLSCIDGTGEPVKWDFHRYRPQVVIVAVGQNDAHPVDFCAQDYDGLKARQWREHYEAFVKTLRRIHPRAQIICMTTILGHHPNWDRSIEEVVKRLGDPGVHHFLFSNNGCGTRGHIRKPEAEKMAAELSAFIESLGEEIWRDESRLEAVMEKGTRREALKIGFLGGSITQGSLASVPQKCYAYQVFQWWKERFPDSEVSYLNAGIGGTTSHFGTARAWEDLLCRKPDVVFVEFSVNDEDEAHFRETYEGLVRKILACDWKPAVVLLHNRFYEDGHSAQRIHDEVGRHYALPRVCLGDGIYPRIVAGEFSMSEVTPDGLHPNDKGHAMLAGMIRDYLDGVWQRASRRERKLTESVEVRSGVGTDRETGPVETVGEAAESEVVVAKSLPAPLTCNRYEEALRLRNFNVTPVSCRGFRKDERAQNEITDVFCHGWIADEKGAEIVFEVEAACIAVQYRKTVNRPAPRAVAFLENVGERAENLEPAECAEKTGQPGRAESSEPMASHTKACGGILLDGNFEENWGDCLYLQTLLEERVKRRRLLTIRIQDADALKTPFYLVSLIVA